MALRFRRSVKLGKGIKLNVSKKGVGMSFGTTGLRQSFHSTGRGTQTIGLPGTGLSYIKRQSLSQKRGGAQQSAGGDVSQNEAVVLEYNNYIQAITHLHLNTPEEIDWEALRAASPPFEPGESGPEEQKARAAYETYQPGLLARIIKPLAKKQKKQLQQAIDQAKEQDTVAYEKWKKGQELAQKVLEGRQDAYIQAIEENNEFADAMERGLSLGVPHAGIVEAEVQVAPEDVIPDKKLTLTKAQNVSKRKMGKKEYYKLTKDFVCSYTLWLSRALFAGLPVESCIVHVTKDALNTVTGYWKNKVLLSVRIDKQTLHQLNLEQIDPSAAMENFEHHINHLKTKGFRAVTRLSASSSMERN